MNKIFYKDVKNTESFMRGGFFQKKVYADDERHIYIFTCGNRFEVILAVRKKNPDGEIVFKYPSDEEWGLYGWTVMTEKDAQKKVAELEDRVDAGFAYKTRSE